MDRLLKKYILFCLGGTISVLAASCLYKFPQLTVINFVISFTTSLTIVVFLSALMIILFIRNLHKNHKVLINVAINFVITIYFKLQLILYQSLIMRFTVFCLFYLFYFCIISPTVIFAAESTSVGGMPYPKIRPHNTTAIDAVVDCLNKANFDISVKRYPKIFGPEIKNFSYCTNAYLGKSFYYQKFFLIQKTPSFEESFFNNLLQLIKSNPKLIAKTVSHVNDTTFDPFQTLLGKKVRDICPPPKDSFYTTDNCFNYMNKLGFLIDNTHDPVFLHAGAQLTTLATIAANPFLANQVPLDLLSIITWSIIECFSLYLIVKC